MTEAELKEIARKAARKYGVDEEMFLRLIKKESSFNPIALGAPIPGRRDRDYGIAQFMPATGAEWYSKLYGDEAKLNPQGWRQSPEKQLYMSAAMMADAKLKFPVGKYGNEAAKMQVASYNTGARNVKEAYEKGGKDWQRYLPNPEETVPYIAAIVEGKKSTYVPSRLPSQKDLWVNKEAVEATSVSGDFFGRFNETPVREMYSFMQTNRVQFDNKVNEGLKFLGLRS